MNAKNNKNNGMNVIENKENEMQVTEESRKAYGRPSVNEEKGWKLDHVIPFDFYHNAYIKSRKGIDELVEMVLKECNISPDDACSWAKDIRTIIKHEIMEYDERRWTLDDWNKTVSGLVGYAIEFQHEAFFSADWFVSHTFEEMKEEHIRQGNWETFLAMMEADATFKEYFDKFHPHRQEA